MAESSLTGTHSLAMRISITHKRSQLYRPYAMLSSHVTLRYFRTCREMTFCTVAFELCGFRTDFGWMTMGHKYKQRYVCTSVSFSGIGARSSTYLYKRIGRYNKLTTELPTPHEFYNERPYLVLFKSSHVHMSSSGTVRCDTVCILYLTFV
jgi:hypothetical protein